MQSFPTLASYILVSNKAKLGFGIFGYAIESISNLQMIELKPFLKQLECRCAGGALQQGNAVTSKFVVIFSFFLSLSLSLSLSPAHYSACCCCC